MNGRELLKKIRNASVAASAVTVAAAATTATATREKAEQSLDSVNTEIDRLK